MQLDEQRILTLAHRFFVQGSIHKATYGGAPLIEFNRGAAANLRSRNRDGDGGWR